MSVVEAGLESCFESLGEKVAYNPWKSILGSLVLTILLASGYPRQEQESRPEKQWVAQGTPSIEQNDYVRSQWPSTARWNAFIAVPRDGGNVLQAKYVKRLYEKYTQIMNIVVDGNKTADELKQKHEQNDDTNKWESYRGMWIFDWSKNKTASEGYNRKCFQFGPFCAKQSVLDVLRLHHDYPSMLDDFSDQQLLRAVNHWGKQESMCPMSLANTDSPCFAKTCMKYRTAEERADCRTKSACYCADICPMKNIAIGNSLTKSVPSDPLTCKDYGCVFVAEMMSNSTKSTSDMCIQTYIPAPVSSTSSGEGAPDGAFEYEPFPIERLVGGIQRDGSGTIISGKSFFGSFSLSLDEYRDKKTQSRKDYVADEWEKQALCKLGIGTPDNEDCPADDLFLFYAQFSRSWGDEFGTAIRSDLAMIGVAYFLMILYLFGNLGKRDPVHRMVGTCVSVLIIIALSVASSFGLAAYLGIPLSQLTNQVYFLLLGLGVDDAFVLVGEYQRAATMHPELSAEDWVIKACRHGGLSILITSATDALAFLIGASTVLPALSWFCIYAGLGVVFCFVYQIIFFCPVLVINGRRAAFDRENQCGPLKCCFGTRKDCLCCFRVTERHSISDPKGCCFCCNCKEALLPKFMEKFGNQITRGAGRIASVFIFSALAAAGITGCTMIRQDFKLEWFIPDGSYVKDFIELSNEQYAQGQRMAIYTRDLDDFAQQNSLAQVAAYMRSSKYVDQDEDILSWIEQFQDFAKNSSTLVEDQKVDASGIFQNQHEFYSNLHEWIKSGGGARFRTSLKWMDSGCNKADETACNPQKGLKGTRMNCVLKLEFTDQGMDRYETMVGLRADLNKIIPPDGDKPYVFPFDFQFLYWEEVGVVGEELWRNIAICAAVILVVVFVLIPAPRIACCVCLCIVLSILETVGFCHFWGVSISGVSTIYILISVGLAVDYSAHIAHMFKESCGSASERAQTALTRIGPSVIQAIISTGLAVVVLAFSKSFIFRVFFKIIFLVIFIAGSHGLWCVPVILSFLGGSKEVPKAAPPVLAKE